MSEDTITVRILRKAELDADSADLTVTVEGSTVISGKEAISKAKELRTLVEALREQGISENQIKLRRVEVNSHSFAVIRTSSARYVISVKNVSIEQLTSVLGGIAAQKGANLVNLSWNYSRLNEVRSRLRREALEEALVQARLDAEFLKVDILGVRGVVEESQGQGYNSEYVDFSESHYFARRSMSGTQDIPLELGNSTTVSLNLLVNFRIGPFQTPTE